MFHYFAAVRWLERHLFPCAFKSFFGIDCPGCGFQRSVISLLKGDLAASFHFYPATLPILLLALFLLAKIKFRFPQAEKISKSLFAIAAVTVIVSYAIKVVEGSYL